jgi:hypothetical protein
MGCREVIQFRDAKTKSAVTIVNTEQVVGP